MQGTHHFQLESRVLPGPWRGREESIRGLCERKAGQDEGHEDHHPITRALQRDVAPQPETRLMGAILRDALREVLQCTASAPHRRNFLRDAVAWILADDPDWPFSFVNVCQALDINASALRSALAPLL